MLSLKQFVDHCNKNTPSIFSHRQGRQNFEDLRGLQNLVNLIVGGDIIDVLCCTNGFGETFFSTVYNLTIKSESIEDGFTILPIIIGDVNLNSPEEFYYDIVRDYETIMQLQASKNTSLS